MLYLFTPAYLSLIIRHPIYRWLPIVMIMWCILVQYVTPIHQAVGHLEILRSRVPIYFIGLNAGKAVQEKQTLDGTSIRMILIMFGMAFASSVFSSRCAMASFPSSWSGCSTSRSR